MTSPRLPPSDRPIAACFRQVRQRLAYMRQQAQALPQLRGFRREMAARTRARLRRETRLQRHARDSHAVADGPWCTGTAQATAAATRHSPLPPTTPEVRMSRYSIPAQDPALTVIVGWDNPVCREA